MDALHLELDPIGRVCISRHVQSNGNVKLDFRKVELVLVPLSGLAD